MPHERLHMLPRQDHTPAMHNMTRNTIWCQKKIANERQEFLFPLNLDLSIRKCQIKCTREDRKVGLFHKVVQKLRLTVQKASNTRGGL